MKLRSILSRRAIISALGALLGGWLPCAGALAQQPSAPNTAGSDLLTSPTEPRPASGFLDRDLLTGDWGGARSALTQRGVTLSAIYTGEVFGNPTGGRRQGAVYDGLLELDLDVDFEKLVHWTGARLHVDAFEIHGASGTNKYVGDFGEFSNIDFYDSFRLFQLYYEQEVALPRVGKFSLRAGQLASDKEFYGSEVSALFINSDFGVLPTLSGNLPTPIYAIAAPGLRLRCEPNDKLYIQAAVYDGNPDPDFLGDPSPGSTPGTTYNYSGTRINLNAKEGAYALFETGCRLNQRKDAKGLPGTYKIGGWYHTDTFSDLRYDAKGRHLADPSSTGILRGHDGDYGGYLVIDQALYRPQAAEAVAASGKDATDGKDSRQSAAASASPEAADTAPGGVMAERGLYAFFRASGAPGDRNTVSFYCDCGLSYRGLLPHRDKDLLGVAVSYARFSDSARDFDRDVNFNSNGIAIQPRDEEVVVEATYQAVLSPWWSVQPDLQVIFHPGGSTAYRDALVVGLRSVVSF